MTIQPGQVPPHFLVFVPGYMGSKLRDKKTGKMVWVDFRSIPLNPLQWQGWVDELLRTLTYPNDDIEPMSIMDEIIFVPPWAKQEHYGRLMVALERMGYRADPARYAEDQRTAYTFPYDWRQDNRRSGKLLAESIERWRAYHPGAQAWLIAHSNGGLVARWYIEKEGGKDHVGRLLLFGSPWDGTPKIMHLLFNGLDSMFRQRFNVFGIPQRSRDLVRSFPSAYQLIPFQDPFLRSEKNQLLDPFSAVGWIDQDAHNSLMLDGKRFNEELGTTTSVETLCFFGRSHPTTTAGLVHLAALSQWSSIDWVDTAAGDGTIPERSAVHPHAVASYPFAASHGDIYANPAALETLKWELADKYLLASKDLVATPHLTVNFEPFNDVLSPGDPVHLWTTVNANDEGSPPVSAANVEVRTEWYKALPGDPEPETLPSDHAIATLQEVSGKPGRYEGSLTAPALEGYYHLRARVDAAGETVHLAEIIAVESKS